jgi:hypothetical protein
MQNVWEKTEKFYKLQKYLECLSNNFTLWKEAIHIPKLYKRTYSKERHTIKNDTLSMLTKT